MWTEYAYLIPLLPILGFLLELFFGKYVKRGGIFANTTISLSLVLSLGLAYEICVLGMPFTEFSWEWFYPGIVAGIVIDPLSVAMACMVSFVSLLIHIFALGYMDEDPDKALYFAETSLFTGSMLGLVFSNNFFQIFIFWELVGFCSYLLIGFWWYKPEAAAAGKKAWLTCSVGDCLFLLGIAILFANMVGIQGVTEPITFSQVFSNLDTIPPDQLTIVTLLILAGVCGKSSQFPLHVWIPDAMEGPTTVSALIHAATMVTAGVYLVARTFPMFFAAPHSLFIVAVVGGFTAIFAATLGLVVNDLKRILAYSTISQLGYMLCMLGVGAAIGAIAVGYSLLHLISHAFFKALLFLCAGCILHATANTRDIREMGGLWEKMKITGVTMLIGALTLTGFPFTSGYFSKDEIILSAYVYGMSGSSILYYLPWIFLTLGVLLTAAYTFRAFFLVFTGKPRSYLAEHSHEAPRIMTIPLMILAFFSLVFGGLVYKKFYSWLGTTFGMDFEHLAELGGHHIVHGYVEVPILIEFLPTILAFTGIGIAFYIYYNNRIDVSKYISRNNPVYRLLWNKYYLDYIYKDIICEKLMITLIVFWDAFDRYVIDGIINGIAWITVKVGSGVRKIQTGVVQTYATAVIIGIVLLILIIWGV
ncbi:MAG: NADH-quinone oxidoreductase subunit L [Candidatus Syntropharchaeia archaeon]